MRLSCYFKYIRQTKTNLRPVWPACRVLALGLPEEHYPCRPHQQLLGQYLTECGQEIRRGRVLSIIGNMIVKSMF